MPGPRPARPGRGTPRTFPGVTGYRRSVRRSKTTSTPPAGEAWVESRSPEVAAPAPAPPRQRGQELFRGRDPDPRLEAKHPLDPLLVEMKALIEIPQGGRATLDKSKMGEDEPRFLPPSLPDSPARPRDAPPSDFRRTERAESPLNTRSRSDAQIWVSVRRLSGSVRRLSASVSLCQARIRYSKYMRSRACLPDF